VAHVVFDNARRLNVLNPPALLDLTEAFLSLAGKTICASSCFPAPAERPSSAAPTSTTW